MHVQPTNPPTTQVKGIAGDPHPTVIDALTYTHPVAAAATTDGAGGGGGGGGAALVGWEALLAQCSRTRRPLVIRNLGAATDWEAYKWTFDKPFGDELGETQVKVSHVGVESYVIVRSRA